MSPIITTWPDFPLQSNRATELIFSSQELISLVNQRLPKIVQIEKLNSQSRNPVYRLRTEDASQSLIVKWYLPWLDRFYDNRFRREEKMLWLLNRWFSDRVPEVYGGIITRNFAVLVQKSVGEQTLDNVLSDTKDEDKRFQIALPGIEFLVDFHNVCQAHYSVFYRTCQSTDLDRLTARTYLRRAQIAVGRLTLLQNIFEEKTSAAQANQVNTRQLEKLATEGVDQEFFDFYSRHVISPLIRAPRQILHNSFSPFHLVCNSHLYLVDFETISVGASQIDLAEFVGAPENALSYDRQLALIEKYYQLKGDKREGDWSGFLENYHSALAVKSLDYAGTTAFHCAKYMAQGNEEKAAVNLSRAKRYRSKLMEALRHSQRVNLGCDLPNLIGR